VGGSKPGKDDKANKKLKRENKARRKMTFMMMSMCGLITIGYCPLIIYMIVSAAGEIPDQTLERMVAIFTMMNSALTPVIYPFMMKKVRAEMVATLGIRRYVLAMKVGLVPTQIGPTSSVIDQESVLSEPPPPEIKTFAGHLARGLNKTMRNLNLSRPNKVAAAPPPTKRAPRATTKK
jgi:hypothetical protein